MSDVVTKKSNCVVGYILEKEICLRSWGNDRGGTKADDGINITNDAVVEKMETTQTSEFRSATALSTQLRSS